MSQTSNALPEPTSEMILLKAAEPLKPLAARSAVKPGVKTSELWVTIGVSLAGLLMAGLAVAKDNEWAAIALAAVAGIVPVFYVKARGLLKAEAAGTTDIIPDAWEPTISKSLDELQRLIPMLEGLNGLVSNDAADKAQPPADGDVTVESVDEDPSPIGETAGD